MQLRFVTACSRRFEIGEGLTNCGKGLIGAASGDLGLREQSHEEGVQHPGPGCPDSGDALDEECEARIPLTLLRHRPAPDRGVESFSESESGASGEFSGSGCVL